VILAHGQPAALADLVADLRLLAPGSGVAVFNGGRDTGLVDGVEADLVPSSRPLRHGFLALFHGLSMEWLSENDVEFDHVVTLDSDAALVRPGLGDMLDRDSRGYLGAHLSEIRPGTPWPPGRRFLPSWPSWQPLFGLEHPLRCFNPVQVFSRTYVERFMSFPSRSRLMERIERTRLEAMEEIVWPSLAATLGCAPAALRGGSALRLSRHAPDEIAQHLQDPDVFFLHKVGLEENAIDRGLIRAHIRGGAPEFAAAPCDYPSGERTPRRLRSAAKDLLHRARPH
jgi:hypothetical protein